MPRILLLALAATVAGGTLLAATFLRPNRDAYEEPPYTVETRYDGFEVRTYQPVLHARVTVPGTRQRATREGFRILAGYIFGGNTARQSIQMTTPVATEAASQTIAMTAPVGTSPAAAGWTVSFMMPAQWTLDTLPVPNDDRIELVEVPGIRAAVRTYSGRASERRNQREEEALVGALQEAGLAPVAGATVAQFDPPWVLGPLRRNELQVVVAPL